MTTEYIEQIFNDYIKTKQTQYAILLNGGWGCGKTYFWKYTLEKISKENQFDTIYLSLNGVNKIEDLDHQLFIKLIPFISDQENKVIKNSTKFLGNVLNKLSSHYLNASLSDIFKGVSVDTFDFSKSIVCFDDLERCQIPITEVLGFVNNLVEHKYLKTIILAHEEEVDRSNGYTKIKEKVIGRDLKFELDVVSTLPSLFEKYKTNIDFQNFLVTQKDVIIEILKEYRQDNLRIITFYLDILEKIFPVFKDVDPRYIQEIILFSVIISIEYKSGSLTSADYKNFKGIDIIDENYYSLNIARAIKESAEEEKARDIPFAETFYRKYLDKNIKDYFFYPSIYSYILSGYFDQKELEQEIKERYPEVIPKEVQEFRILLHYKFRELSDKDFKTLTKNVLKYANEGKYSIYDYIQIAKFYYFFSENQLISESKEEIYKIIKHGLGIVKLKKEIDDRILQNLLHFKDDNPDISTIKQYVKDIHDEIKKEEYIVISNELIDCLTKNDELELIEFFEKHKFSNEFFQYTDEEILLDTILNTSNKQLFTLTELLRNRYNIGNIGEFLFEDIGCLNKIERGLSNYLDNNENIEHLRKYLLVTLKKDLLFVIQRLNNTRVK